MAAAAVVVVAGAVVAPGMIVTVVVRGAGQEPVAAALFPWRAGAAKETDERAKSVKVKSVFANIAFFSQNLLKVVEKEKYLLEEMLIKNLLEMRWRKK